MLTPSSYHVSERLLATQHRATDYPGVQGHPLHGCKTSIHPATATATRTALTFFLRASTSLQYSTGAAHITFLVKQPPATAGSSATISDRSAFLPAARSDAYTPAEQPQHNREMCYMIRKAYLLACRSMQGCCSTSLLLYQVCLQPGSRVV